MTRKKTSDEEIYNAVLKVSKEINDILKKYSQSEILATFYYEQLETFVYSQLALNFFHNLNKKIVKKLNLPDGFITNIKKRYENLGKELRRLKFMDDNNTFIQKDYNNFKSSVKKDYPGFSKIFIEIEKEVKMDKLKRLLSTKKIKFKNQGERDHNCTSLTYITTLFLEIYIEKHRKLPSIRELSEMMTKVTTEYADDISQILYTEVKKSYLNFEKENSENLIAFLYEQDKKWGKILTKANYFITLSEEIGKEVFEQWKKYKKLSQKKYLALIKIHARSVQIAREIFCLSENGFADGALSRWRSLHELEVISIFLAEQNNNVSERYLEHEDIKKYLDVKEYNKYFKKLKQSPPDKNNYRRLYRKYQKLISKYGKQYQFNGGYGWIPPKTLRNPKTKKLLPQQTFNNLEIHTDRAHYIPYFRLSSNSVHGGASGFYRVGLAEDSQEKVLLTGRTTTGISEPLELMLISMNLISTNLLPLEKDLSYFYQSFLEIKVLHLLLDEILNDIKKQIDNP